MVCSELGLHGELANSVLSQFGVILGPWRAMESPNLASGFQSSSYFILYPYIKITVHPHPPTLLLPPPSHPITTTCDIIRLPARKKLLKTDIIRLPARKKLLLGIRNVYTHALSDS